MRSSPSQRNDVSRRLGFNPLDHLGMNESDLITSPVVKRQIKMPVTFSVLGLLLLVLAIFFFLFDSVTFRRCNHLVNIGLKRANSGVLDYEFLLVLVWWKMSFFNKNMLVAPPNSLLPLSVPLPIGMTTLDKCAKGTIPVASCPASNIY